jgi:hypothetical protein
VPRETNGNDDHVAFRHIATCAAPYHCSSSWNRVEERIASEALTHFFHNPSNRRSVTRAQCAVMAVSGHRTPEAAQLYLKRTEKQRLAAARKRRAWVESERREDSFQNTAPATFSEMSAKGAKCLM